ATSHLSEAILDRFELVVLDYQDEAEETAIVQDRLKLQSGLGSHAELLPLAAVRLARYTRTNVRVKRGASVRAALSVAEIGAVLMQSGKHGFREAFLMAALMALPTRIEIEREAESELSFRHEVESLITEWVKDILDNLSIQSDMSTQSQIADRNLKKKT
ncbi:MAG: hypothetical protein ABIQ95_04185, partial [Bdellovibrionia bacterium]